MIAYVILKKAKTFWYPKSNNLSKILAAAILDYYLLDW
jgi:hypothetical protein